MKNLMPGQRISLESLQGWKVSPQGKAERVAVMAVREDGAVFPFIRSDDGSWCLSQGLRPDLRHDILLTITDDRTGGFANEAYPLSMTIDGGIYSLSAPSDQLATVILAEVYSKNGQRMKISNEGFTFGLVAYARARSFPLERFSGVRASRPPHPHEPGQQNSPQQTGRGEFMASGSGVVIAHGLIVTNAHVIADGRRFQLGGTLQDLRPVAIDEQHDLALLQGDFTSEALPLRTGNGKTLWLGESVIVGGYPLMDILGADLKVTTGNVSGLAGPGGDATRFQFTAPIGSGSSGGAVIDDHGNLVGIVSASLAHENMRVRGTISENVNFGIKISLVQEMMAIAGVASPEPQQMSGMDRRDVVQRMRRSVVSLLVQ